MLKKEGLTEKERESFGNCSALEGPNDLPLGTRGGGKLYRLTIK